MFPAYFGGSSAEFSLYLFQKSEIDFVRSWRFIANRMEGPEPVQILSTWKHWCTEFIECLNKSRDALWVWKCLWEVRLTILSLILEGAAQNGWVRVEHIAEKSLWLLLSNFCLRGTSIQVDGWLHYFLFIWAWTDSLILAINLVAGVPQEKNLRYPETDFSECFLTMPEVSYTHIHHLLSV